MRAFISLLVTTIFSHNIANAGVIRSEAGVGAVVSNGQECGPIGMRVLQDGGNAFDAAIAVLLCEGVTGPQSMGIGGGFLATVYAKSQTKEQSVVKTINARETAPTNSSKDMFQGLPEIKGGHATAIPGEIRGYWKIRQNYGSENYSWKQIFEHTINLCENGYKVDSFLARILKAYETRIIETESLREIFINTTTNKVYEEGSKLTRPILAQTLRNISESDDTEFYGGITGQNFIDDVRSMGGILTIGDLRNYRVEESDAISTQLTDSCTLYTVPVPGSGNVLSTILKLAKDEVNAANMNASTRIHRVVETFKHGYGIRSELADANFENITEVLEQIVGPQYLNITAAKIRNSTTSQNPLYYSPSATGVVRDYGTSNVAVIDKDGNAITATSTINNVFGAFVRSRKTGIILNDEMDDFSTPDVKNSYGFEPSQINYIKPGKRPMSSMVPSIILENGEVRLLVGAAGGSQITTSVALTILRHIFMGQTLLEAISGKRFHHQLLPMAVQYEKGFHHKEVLKYLQAMGHNITEISTLQGFGAVTGISVVNGEVTPVFDIRRGGSAVTTRGSSL